MSRFYHRYNEALRKSEEDDPTGGPNSNFSFLGLKSTSSHAIMVPVNGGSPKTRPKTRSKQHYTRKVQVYTASEVLNEYPDHLIDQITYDKADKIREKLKEAIKRNYIFADIDESAMTAIVDCMRPTFAEADEVS